MKIPHTATHRGKRVLLVLRDGTRVSGRFVTRTDRWVELDVGKVHKKYIKAFIVMKGVR